MHISSGIDSLGELRKLLPYAMALKKHGDESSLAPVYHKGFDTREHPHEGPRSNLGVFSWDAKARTLGKEHIHVNRVSFVGNERYIGCSKPFCYCCNLYASFHPGLCLPRPCHGNTWIN
jgi:hypothetical protein